MKLLWRIINNGRVKISYFKRRYCVFLMKKWCRQKSPVFPLNIDCISWLKQMASSIFITSSQTNSPIFYNMLLWTLCWNPSYWTEQVKSEPEAWATVGKKMHLPRTNTELHGKEELSIFTAKTPRAQSKARNQLVGAGILMSELQKRKPVGINPRVLKLISALKIIKLISHSFYLP